MKKVASIVLVILMIVLTAACAVPAADQMSDEETPEMVTPVPITEQYAITAATADELREMIKIYAAEDNCEMLYAAALRLTEIEPTDASAYTQAADALLKMAKGDVEKINGLLAQGVGKAEDARALKQWADQNQVDFTIEIPFLPDYTSLDETNTSGITVGNQTNAAKYGGEWHGGLLTWQGEWVYLSQPYEDYAVFKVRADGSDYQRVGEICGTSLNVIGDWLYYSNAVDSTPWRVRTDGSLNEQLSYDVSGFLSIEDGYMYYDNGSDNGCLYKVSIDGSERVKLSDGMVIFSCVADGYVYYCEKSMDGGLYRISVNGGEKQQITSGFIQTYCVADGWVYYIDVNDPFGVRRVRTDGTDCEMFFPFDFKIVTINVLDGTLAIGFNVSYEEDGFFITEEIVLIDIATLGKKQHIEADTEPLCTGPEGRLYFTRFNEKGAWYAMDANGETSKVE